MLTPRKKISRKELHQDALLTKMASASDFVQEHKEKLTYVVGGLAAIVIFSWAYFSYRSNQNTESVDKLVQAEQFYFAGNYREAIRRLEKFCTEYDGTTGGSLGTFYLANSYFNTDQFDYALENFEKYVDEYGDNQVLLVSAEAGIAACHEGLNQFQEAADYYEKIISKYDSAPNRAEMMMDLARCYKILNKAPKAKEWYQRIVDDYPASASARDAKAALEELGA